MVAVDLHREAGCLARPLQKLPKQRSEQVPKDGASLLAEQTLSVSHNGL